MMQLNFLKATNTCIDRQTGFKTQPGSFKTGLNFTNLSRSINEYSILHLQVPPYMVTIVTKIGHKRKKNRFRIALIYWIWVLEIAQKFKQQCICTA